jgi:hypothetical protein
VGRVATLAATDPYIWPIDSSKAESLMFEPWIGPHYDATRLLLLGESAYSWTDCDSTLQHPTPDHCRKLVEWVVGGFEECRSGPEKLPFMVKVSRALANDECPPRSTFGTSGIVLRSRTMSARRLATALACGHRERCGRLPAKPFPRYWSN